MFEAIAAFLGAFLGSYGMGWILARLTKKRVESTGDKPYMGLPQINPFSTRHARVVRKDENNRIIKGRE